MRCESWQNLSQLSKGTHVKKESRILLQKGINSLLLSIEHFNRPWDTGRVDATLILMDHSFEMLLKAAILARGGKIRKPRETQAIGFGECVRKGLSEGQIKFLTEPQALTLQTINTLRDAAQHHIVTLSEDLLYVHTQSGLTLFRDLLRLVFNESLTDYFPDRVLPVSTRPPTDIATLFQFEIQKIREILKPGARKMVEAKARLRGLSILEGSIQGTSVQPTEGELLKLTRRIQGGEQWNRIFPGVASIQFTTKGFGPSLDLRISNKEGVPVHIVPEGTPGSGVVALKRVDELGFYNLNLTQLAEKLELTVPRTLALVLHLGLQQDRESYKEIKIGAAIFKRYSQKALERLRKELPVIDMAKIWAQYSPRLTRSKMGHPAP